MTPASYRWPLKWLGNGGATLLSRRLWLASALASTLPAQQAEVGSFDFSLLDGPIIPADLFFVREHFPVPNVSAAGWELSVGGAVATPLRISFDDLAAQPRKTLPVTIECAENPGAGGLVGNAEWSGVSLASLLEKARPDPEARFVTLSGADGFSRSVPLAKAIHPDTLIALGMNGEKLPVKHGFPLRALIPGWYGMDSIKWLRGVEVLAGEAPVQGYLRQVRSLLAGSRPAGPVAAMNVKSAFSRPLDGATLIGRRFVLRGAAWAGENRIAQVDISVDGAKTWQTAKLASNPMPYSWVEWSHDWKIAGIGPHDLAVRATDDKGRQQPAERPSDRVDDYEGNAWQTIRVTVT